MANYARTVLLTAALWGGVSSAIAQPETPNEMIVKFCKDNLWEKVGDGECASLAEGAMKSAGVRPRSSFKDSPNEEDYVWGDLVYSLEIKIGGRDEKKVPAMSIKPGDVIQLRNVRFQAQSSFMVYPHHTAIVRSVKDGGKVLTVFEQNVAGKKIVMVKTFRLNELNNGWLRVYRPVPPK
jgi:hypothetical protein